MFNDNYTLMTSNLKHVGMPDTACVSVRGPVMF